MDGGLRNEVYQWYMKQLRCESAFGYEVCSSNTLWSDKPHFKISIPPPLRGPPPFTQGRQSLFKNQL